MLDEDAVRNAGQSGKPPATQLHDKNSSRSVLSFRQIEIFRAVMITKSVNGAGRMLNCAQPGLSRALKHMESKVGFSLFHRSNGRLLPTQEATLLFEEIQVLYKDIERVDQFVCRLAAGEDSVFRMGAPPSLAHSMVPLILRKLRQKFKNFSLHLDILPIEQVTDYLVFQRGEYALTVFDVNHPNVVSECIGHASMVCAMHESHPMASAKKLSVKDIRKEHIISFQTDTPHAGMIRDMFKQAGIELRPSTFVRFAETAMALVQHDLGVAIVDEFTAMKTNYPNVRIVKMVEEGALPIFINRGRLTPRSAVGNAFDKAARVAFAD